MKYLRQDKGSTEDKMNEVMGQYYKKCWRQDEGRIENKIKEALKTR